ncbi:MAG: response regulator [Chloroflexi bacterium]|nr:response regulator [Chloroflexota bacterium]
MSNLKNWNVLIVEDEVDGQEVVEGILSYFNIATDVAATAEEAIQLLGKNRYTAAVIDLGLPGIDGLELMRYIREQPALSGLPSIAITAYHTSKLKSEALEAGFDAYFAKPLDDTSFARELERVVMNAS